MNSEATETMTAREVADLLQCTEETVIEKAAAGLLAAVKFGRSWVFLRAALMEGLHRTALSNIRPKPASRSKAASEPLAYAVTVPQGTRANAKTRVRPTLPDLRPFEPE